MDKDHNKDLIKPLSKDEIPLMKEACRLAAQTLVYIESFIKPGISTLELDNLVYDFTLSNGAKPSPLGYHGYPASICTSINHIVCHGVPDKTLLKEGDIINVDITSYKNGFHGDCSATFCVGTVSSDALDLISVAKEARDRGIEEIRPGATTGDIGFVIDKLVTRKGYSTVKEIGGHGIGRQFHQDPFVPSFGKRGRGDLLIPWRCITVEPMINQGTDEVIEKAVPNSTIKYYETADQKLSAQFEHTVLITDTGYEILTLA